MRIFVPSLLITLLLILISAVCPYHAASGHAPKGTVRVGIFPFEPFNFIDAKGEAQGLNADLLREIVRDEEWRVEYVAGSWAEGLERLQNQQIDLMLSVAYTPQRAETMDFTYESVVELWGQVFVRPEGQSYNITDLARRKVGIMRKDISGSNFITTANNFKVKCQIREYATHAEVFAAVQAGEVDAGVAPQHFGLRHADEYQLVGSSILFSPFSIYFASKKGTQHQLLSHIDAHLASWKKNRESAYYQSVNRWLGAMAPKAPIPAWLLHGLISAVAIAFFFACFVLLLKRNVHSKTKELRLSEERFRDIVLSSNDWIWEIDPQAVLSYCSEHVIALLGYQPAEVLGQKPYDFIVGAQQLQAKNFYRDLLDSPKPFRNFENWHLRRDGRPICLVMAGTPIFSPEGLFLGYRGVATDISERKHADEALRESETSLRTYLNSAPFAIFVCDEQGKFHQVNPAACRMTGYHERELLTMGMTDLTFDQESDSGLTHFNSVVKNDHNFGGFPFRHSNGERRWWSVTAVKVADNRFLGFCNDITDLKLAEQERNRLQAQLTQAQKMEAIGTLAGGIAHDFNNILGAIIGYAEMAKDDCAPDSNIAHDVDQILKAGNRAKELVKQILAFSRQAKVDQVPLDPAQIVQESITLLRASLPATISIEADILADAGMILADPVQIHQIVINLCTNAFHAMEDEGGRLRITLRQRTAPAGDAPKVTGPFSGEWIDLVISDTGVGIAQENLAKIFDPYFTTKEVGKGTGMGLAMVHGIVQSYGGKIGCRSELGLGTEFTISLPTIIVDRLPNGGIAEPIPTGSEHILLVDDEQLLVEMGQSMLERLGYRVTGQSNSLEALAIFQADPTAFDLILTDQTMPAMTGFDLARQMRQIRPDLPIILCTGYSSQISHEKATALGIKGFAMKPLAKREIADLIRATLDADSAGR